MPGENPQVTLEDSGNENEVTQNVNATPEATPAMDTTSTAEDTAPDPFDDTDAHASEDANSTDSQEEQPATQTQSELAPSASKSHPMLRFGGAMLAASVVILIAAIVIAVTSRRQPPESALINEFRTSMDKMTRKLSKIEAKTDAPPAIIIGEVGNFDDFTRMIKVANTQFMDGRFEEAAQAYASAITLDSSGKLSDEAHYRLGMCQLKTGKPDEAIGEFRFVVENHPGSHHYAASALEMGELLMAKKNFTQARRLFYMVLGSEGQLTEDQQDVLEHTYYAIAQAYEREAEAIEATRYNPQTALDFGQ